MKIRTFILFFVLMELSVAMAQSPWILQHAVGLHQSADPQLALSAVDKNTCWGCGMYSQFVRTTDGGSTWRVGTIDTGQCACISAVDSSTAWIAVVNPSGILKTTDGGLTWTKNANIYQDIDSFPFYVHFFDANNGVCVGSPSRGNWEIYTTSNGGADWARVPSGNIPLPLTGELPLFITGSPPLPAVAADNCLWFTTRQGSLYRTTDRGMTWTVTRHVMNTYTFSPFVAALKDSLNGMTATFLNESAIKRTTDGGVTWTSVSLPSPLFSLWNVAYEKGTSGTYFITGIANHRENIPTTPGTALTTDNGATWVKINSLPVWAMDFAPDGTGWGGGANDSVYKWIGFADKMIAMEQPNIDKIFARKDIDSVLFKTTFLNFSNHQFTANLIYTNLENTLTDSLTLYDDGLHGDSLPVDGIYGGYILPMNVEDFFSLNVSTTEDSTNKYVNTPVGLRFTTAGPVKLDSLSVSQIASTVYSVKPFFRNDGSSYTVKDLKIKITKVDNSITQIIPDTVSISSIAPGATAGPANDVNITVNSRFSGALDLNFDIMSNGWTYWTGSTSQTVTGVDDIKQVPLSYNLSQNYPNPFNPSTKINFSIPEYSRVSLKVYDVLGKEVAILVNEEKQPGTYEVNFKAANLSSGIYFYRLQVDPSRVSGKSFTQTKKMILMK